MAGPSAGRAELLRGRREVQALPGTWVASAVHVSENSKRRRRALRKDRRLELVRHTAVHDGAVPQATKDAERERESRNHDRRPMHSISSSVLRAASLACKVHWPRPARGTCNDPHAPAVLGGDRSSLRCTPAAQQLHMNQWNVCTGLSLPSRWEGPIVCSRQKLSKRPLCNQT